MQVKRADTIAQLPLDHQFSGRIILADVLIEFVACSACDDFAVSFKVCNLEFQPFGINRNRTIKRQTMTTGNTARQILVNFERDFDAFGDFELPLIVGGRFTEHRFMQDAPDLLVRHARQCGGFSQAPRACIDQRELVC